MDVAPDPSKLEQDDAPEALPSDAAEASPKDRGRRAFTSGVLVTAGLAAGAYPLVQLGVNRYATDPAQGPRMVRVLDLSSLPRAGTPPVAVRVKSPVRDGWRIRDRETLVYVARENPENPTFTVMSALCSHAGCYVEFDRKAGEFLCPCHKGVFKRDGSVKDGPPTQPLARLPWELRADGLYVDLEARAPASEDKA